MKEQIVKYSKELCMRLICEFTGRHKWKFEFENLEGHKVFKCKRCGKDYMAPL